MDPSDYGEHHDRSTRCEQGRAAQGVLPAARRSPTSDHDEAMKQLADILNQVEDEMTPIPYDPTFPLNDGRMYPPQPDSQRAVAGRPNVTRYRSKGHSTNIGDNGAIQIIDHRTGDVVFDKPGPDGRTIGEGA